MTPKICVSITGETVDEVVQMIKSAEHDGVDLFEIRLDYLKEDADLSRIRGCTERLLIATERLSSEGGFFEGTEEERMKTLLEAARVGFNLIDIELETPGAAERVQELREARCKVIVSSHTTERPDLSRLEATFGKERQLRPDLCKIVTRAETMSDNLTSLQFLAQASALSETICFCMGPMGRVSRVLSPLFGGAFTYAAVARGKEAASGQLTAPEMRQLYRLLGVNYEDNK